MLTTRDFTSQFTRALMLAVAARIARAYLAGQCDEARRDYLAHKSTMNPDELKQFDDAIVACTINLGAGGTGVPRHERE